MNKIISIILLTLMWFTINVFSFGYIYKEDTFFLDKNDLIKEMRIENVYDKPIAVEINIRDRLINEFGQESLGDISNDFIVLPDQLFLMPEEIAYVQIMYEGPTNIDYEKYFRIILSQKDISNILNKDELKKDQEEDKDKLKFNVTYLVNYHVHTTASNSKFNSQLKLNSIKEKYEPEKKHYKYSFYIENSGSSRGKLNGLIFKSKNNKISYQNNGNCNINSQVFAKSNLVCFITSKEKINVNDFHVVLEN